VLFPKEKKCFDVKKGQMILIPQGAFHHAQTDEGQAVCRLCFHFSLGEGRENTLWHRLVSGAAEPKIVESETLNLAMERCEGLLREEDGVLRNSREGVLLLDVILSVLGSDGAEKNSVRSKEQTRSRQKWLIEEYVGTRYHAADGLEGLAKKLYLSQRQTRKLVRRFFGEDFKALMVRQRMDVARIFLESEDLSLEEIAESVGYRSYSGFHLAFVRSFGRTPGEYRKRAREEKN
jgi:AraC-like DNA-binding protein